LSTTQRQSGAPLRSGGWIGVAIWVAASVLSGCGDDDSSTADGGAAGGGGSSGRAAAGGGGRSGRGAAGQGGGTTAELGAACEQDSDCGRDWFCDMEVERTASVAGAPNGDPIDSPLFPGGSCTPIMRGVYDPQSSCDPTEPVGAQGCTTVGVCSIESVEGEQQVACRRACEPRATETGCSREGYTCDFGSHACVEACRSDVECRVQLVDSNGDGEPDGAAYDRDSQAVCDADTGRCTHEGGDQKLGASCMRDEECADDGLCISGDAQVAGHRFADGYCTRLGCDVEGRECGDDAVCARLRPALNPDVTDFICLTRCKVGAEAGDEKLRIGPDGHGEGCRDGYRCFYNGGPGADSGVCVSGEYNAITNNNIGKGCEEASDCYSPFGAGFCLRYGLPGNQSSGGICTILDCNAPGLPDDVCGEGNECLGSSGDQTQCMHNCKDANECPPGFACADDDGESTTPGICYPVCEKDLDCRQSERCRLFTGQMVGQCVLQ
jgi:hypothetical protein